MDPDAARARMVERQLRRRGIVDERVLAAMGAVPRERFVPGRLRSRAYADEALAIPAGQTISQPWIVAAICQALELRGSERVLEIGTGSGYSACVLAELASRVISVERIAELADSARAAIEAAGCGDRVEVVDGDGSLGHPSEAPYQAIAVHAAIPGPPRALLDQLAGGGRLVAPLAEGWRETLTVFERAPDASGPTSLRTRAIAPCRFVPLLGAEGFPED